MVWRPNAVSGGSDSCGAGVLRSRSIYKAKCFSPGGCKERRSCNNARFGPRVGAHGGTLTNRRTASVLGLLQSYMLAGSGLESRRLQRALLSLVTTTLYS